MSNLTQLLPGVPLVESPLFPNIIEQIDFTPHERMIALELHQNGFAAIDFPDPDINIRIDRIKERLSPHFAVNFSDPAAIKNTGDLRIQDAWRFDEDVKAIASNHNILNLLSRLYGRRAFPFQTLNFPVGTEQNLHSDSVHFSSQPERFMCGVWLAMEDISQEAGPLRYCPGSHKWPILSNAMIGRRGWGSTAQSAQSPFEEVWDAMRTAKRASDEVFLARKGQALIWTANLLHGGSKQIDRTQTRWSQVTHYYFADCMYYTPAFSDEAIGQLDLRTITNISTGEIEPNRYLGDETFAHQIAASSGRSGKKWSNPLKKWKTPKSTKGLPDIAELPADFDPDVYLRLNEDVAAAGRDPAEHYIIHGRNEGRRYR